MTKATWWWAVIALVAAACGTDVTTPPIEEPPAPPPVVARVQLFPTRDSITSFKYRRRFTASAYDAGQQLIPNKSATWTSSAPSVVTVDADGVVAPVWQGTATVTASIDGVTGQARVTVGPELVAFVSERTGDFEIFVAASDGTGARNVTSNPALDEEPHWSPDGTRIAFRSERDGDGDIYVMNSDGSDLVNVSNTAGNVSRYVSWSPDATRIVFASIEDTAVEELYVVGVDGSDLKPLTQCGCINDMPEWSPDGTRIAFQSVRDTARYPDIYTMAADGSDLIDLTNDRSADVYPRWSPDGGTILFTTGREGPWRVYTMSSTGTDPRRLVDLLLSAALWSPDGQWIAFVGHPAVYEPAVYLIRPDGTGMTQLLEYDWLSELSWSPDSQELAFTYSVNTEVGPANIDVGMLLLDGHSWPVTRDLTHDWTPRMQPRRPE